MTTKERLMQNFLKVMEEYGETFFSCGDTDKDYNLVTSTLDHQGYWAGVSLRYFFDYELNLVETEERRFGV